MLIWETLVVFIVTSKEGELHYYSHFDGHFLDLQWCKSRKGSIYNWPIVHPNISSQKREIYVQIVHPTFHLSSIPHSSLIPSNHNCFWENFDLSSKQWFHPPPFGLNSSNSRFYALSSRLKAHANALFNHMKPLSNWLKVILSGKPNSRRWGCCLLLHCF